MQSAFSSVDFTIMNGINKVEIDPSMDNYYGFSSTAIMFFGLENASSFEGFEHLKTDNVESMERMFSGDENAENVPNTTNWNTSNVKDMSRMFYKFALSSELFDAVPDVSEWDTSKVTDFSEMFLSYAANSTKLDETPEVGGWDTSKVTDFSKMFQSYACMSDISTTPNVTNWKTSSAESIDGMFSYYGENSSQFELDLTGWDLSSITKESYGDMDLQPVTMFASTATQASDNAWIVKIPAETVLADGSIQPNSGDKWYCAKTNVFALPDVGYSRKFTLGNEHILWKGITPFVAGADWSELDVAENIAITINSEVKIYYENNEYSDFHEIRINGKQEECSNSPYTKKYDEDWQYNIGNNANKMTIEAKGITITKITWTPPTE